MGFKRKLNVLIPRDVRQFRQPLVVITVIFLFYYVFSPNQDTDRTVGRNDEVLQFRQERYIRNQSSEDARQGPGEKGQGVPLEMRDEANVTIKKDVLNRIANDKISPERSLNDVRDPRCKIIKYPDALPTASVVIVFRNVVWSSLLRTVHSVVNRSPPQYLREVILFDFSDKESSQKQWTEYVNKTWPDHIVRIVRTNERIGPIQARLAVAKAATGDVLIFLEPQCEVSPGWLVPLLARIQEDRTSVVCPTMDVISQQNIEYIMNIITQRGGFKWDLSFTWIDIPEREETRKHTYPIRSPTMPNGVFAVDRNYFFDVGAYDEGMSVSGGEHLEMSFRVWMCGGKVEIIPCSRVGQLFESGRPSNALGNNDTNTMYNVNLLRIAEVWMDEYRRLFYSYRRDLLMQNAGDFKARTQLRERLNCKSFEWYLNNVYPEKFIPDENVQAWGTIRNPRANLCLDNFDKDEKTMTDIRLFKCEYGSIIKQVFSLTLKDQLRRENGCLRTKGNLGDRVKIMKCSPEDKLQMWKHDKTSSIVVHVGSGRCLDVADEMSGGHVHIAACSNATSQKWVFEHYL